MDKVRLKEYKIIPAKKGAGLLVDEKITVSSDAESIIRKFYGEDIEVYESFFALYLNRQNKPLGYTKIGQGGVSSTTADVKLISLAGIKMLATTVIIAHNHPSGNTNPSELDIKLTNKTKEGLGLLDIQMLDHIILSPNKGEYYSFADEGLI